MISKELADKIMQKVCNEWARRHKDGVDPAKVAAVTMMVNNFPHADGKQRVTDISTGKTHLVPLEYIILHGLHGSELENFPEEKKSKAR